MVKSLSCTIPVERLPAILTMCRTSLFKGELTEEEAITFVLTQGGRRIRDKKVHRFSTSNSHFQIRIEYSAGRKKSAGATLTADFSHHLSALASAYVLSTALADELRGSHQVIVRVAEQYQEGFMGCLGDLSAVPLSRFLALIGCMEVVSQRLEDKVRLVFRELAEDVGGTLDRQKGESEVPDRFKALVFAFMIAGLPIRPWQSYLASSGEKTEDE